MGGSVELARRGLGLGPGAPAPRAVSGDSYLLSDSSPRFMLPLLNEQGKVLPLSFLPSCLYELIQHIITEHFRHWEFSSKHGSCPQEVHKKTDKKTVYATQCDDSPAQSP